MELTIDAAWVIGMLLASIRVAAFVVASPIFSTAIPTVARVSFVLVLGFAFNEPVTGETTLAMLLQWAFTNAAIGAIVGFLTGLLFWIFSVAGGLIDFSSTLSAAQVFDPVSQTDSPVFGRIFNLGALALFLVLGGDRLLIAGLGRTFDAVSVTGGIVISQGGFAEIAVELISRLMIASAELAMPALAALFLTEVVLGVASRFAPQANVFLIGIPAKVLVAFASVAAVLVLVPETMDGLMGLMRDVFRDSIGVLRG